MNDLKICLDKQNLGECTRGEDCEVCNLSKQLEETVIKVNFNPNAKVYIPKSKRVENNTNSTNNIENTNKLSFNLKAQEYVPKNNKQNSSGLNNKNSVDYQVYYYDQDKENNDLQEENYEDDGREFDMIMKDIINSEALEELEDEEEESDDEKWYPKYKECECCKGFVYKCQGIACKNMNACYCKVKDECDEEA